MAELGVGDLAKRRDPGWAATILVDRFDESMPSDAEEVEDPGEQLSATDKAFPCAQPRSIKA